MAGEVRCGAARHGVAGLGEVSRGAAGIKGADVRIRPYPHRADVGLARPARLFRLALGPCAGLERLLDKVVVVALVDSHVVALK
jgi:hypothetical protein